MQTPTHRVDSGSALVDELEFIQTLMQGEPNAPYS